MNWKVFLVWCLSWSLIVLGTRGIEIGNLSLWKYYTSIGIGLIINYWLISSKEKKENKE